ncbi:hypothetical protein, partial [Pseudomonas urmiensis]|uniref:hypothetical protein n=1 Tax=Pseudomonas urmiensis TaxID=2745493 RepID=UPI0034D3E846
SLQVIYKSLLGKAPPYLSSLVTIAASPQALQQVYLTGHPQSQFILGRLSFHFYAANEAGNSYLPY